MNSDNRSTHDMRAATASVLTPDAVLLAVFIGIAICFVVMAASVVILALDWWARRGERLRGFK